MQLGVSSILGGNVMGAVSSALNDAKGEDLLNTVKRLSAENAANIDKAKQAGDFKKVKASLDKFEELLMSQMLGFMFDTVSVDENFGGGFGEELTRSMLTDEYGKIMAKSGTLGISDGIQKELIRHQIQASIKSNS